VELKDAQFSAALPYYDPSTKSFGSTPPAPTLAEAQTAQVAAIQSSFGAACAQAVTDSNGVAWSGGEQSALSLDGAIRLAQQLNQTTVDLWDASNAKHSLSIADAQAAAQAVASQYQSDYAKWQSLRAQIMAATTVSAVQAITW